MNFSDLNRSMMRIKINRVVGFFKRQGEEFSSQKYDELDNISRLELIANAIERVLPSYKIDFYNNESKKEKDKQINLPEHFNLSDIVESAIGIETTVKALEIFYANRLGHICRDAQKRLVYSLLGDSNKKNSEYPSLMYDLSDRRKINKIVLNAHRFFVAEKRGNNKGMQIVQNSLRKLGISSDDLNLLRQRGYDILSEGYINCMDIKDKAIAEEIEMLREDDTQSYGIKRTTDKDGTKNTLFVMDVPCFGQMSVHIYDLALISGLSEHKYRYPIYQRENVLLTDLTSEYQEYFMYAHPNDLVEALKGLRNQRDAHEIAVKSGLTKDEISELYSKKGDAR